MKHFVDIQAVKDSFDTVQRQFEDINKILNCSRDPFDDDVKNNMILGYEFLNEILAEDKDLFTGYGLNALLEMNAVIHCGHDRKLRDEYKPFLKETEFHFYSHVQPILRWYNKHQNDENVLKVAAEVYVGALSTPQLYMEGNHRTGSLIASHILLKGGHPPFVLNVENAVEYFNPCSQIKFTDKRNVKGYLKLPKFRKSFVKFLKRFLDEKYLVTGGK